MSDDAADRPRFAFLGPWPVTHGFIFVCGAAYVVALFLGGLGRGGGFGFGGPTHGALWAVGSFHAAAVLHDGAWDRIVTANVLHLGVLHILMNASAMLKLGGALESNFGARRTAFVFGASGLGASGAGVLYAAATGVDSSSAGASGVGCGAGAALWMLLQDATDPALREHRRQMFAWLVVCLLMGLIPGISFLGHAGGAAGGVFAGLLLRRELRRGRRGRGLERAGVLLLLIFAAGLAVSAACAPERWEQVQAWARAAGRPVGTGR